MTQTESGASGPGYAEHPGYRVEILPCPKRIRVTLGGETVVDSLRTVLIRETAHTPVYYFPRDDVRLDLTSRTEHSTY